MSNALPLPLRSSVLSPSVKPVPAARPSGFQPTIARPTSPVAHLSLPERMQLSRERIRKAAQAGERVRSYEVALEVDLSEFHFARQFRAAFGSSPHAYYDEVRAEVARELLARAVSEGEAARRIGLRRPAELRALLQKFPAR